LNFTGVDAAAGAFAAVVTALAGTATLYLQWRSAKLAVPSAAHGVPASPSGTQDLEAPPAADRDTKIPKDASPEMPRGDTPLTVRRERWLTPKRIAFPPLLGIAAGLIVVLVGAWLTGNQHPSIQINSPSNGTAVSQQKGFQASGKSSDLGNDTIWLADYDGGYAVDSEATIKVGGSWTASDSSLGNPGQALPFPQTARVIVADTECANALQAAMNSTQDYLTSLPGGCEIAGAVTVEVTRR
jgi:hypothetical protein